MSGRGWVAIGAAGAVVAALLVAWVVTRGGSGEEDGAGKRSRIAELGPVVLDGDLVVGGATVSDGDLPPTSVGSSTDGYVVSYQERSSGASRVLVLDRDGAELRRVDDTFGLAITDPGSGSAAWVEGTGRRRELVLAEVGSGDELGRWPVDAFALPGAVHGAEVAVSDGETSQVYRAGDDEPATLGFVPAGDVVLDLDDDLLVTGDLDGRVTTWTRDGEVLGELEGMFSAVLDPAGDRLAGIGQPEPAVVAGTDGAVEPLDLDDEAVLGVAWHGRSTVVVDVGVAAAEEQVGARYACDAAARSCRAVPAPDGATVGTLVSNDAVGQLLVSGG